MILVDSDVLIAHLRGVEAARTWLHDARERTGPLGTSIVSIAEITGGMRSAERREVWQLLASFDAHEVDEVVARQAGAFARRHRRSHPGIGVADYLIAGTADVHGLELATLNVRHYPMFESLVAPFTLAP